MQLEPFTVDLWLKTLRRKKAKVATGPDGWSGRLINMPKDLVQQILDMLRASNGPAVPSQGSCTL